MSYLTTHKIGIRLVFGRIYHTSIEIFRRYRCFLNVLGSQHMLVFCMRRTSMGSIRKRSSVSPQTKDVDVGIMLKHTDIILKYLRRDKRNRDVHPENGFINCKVREGGWVQIILFFHLISANVKPLVTPTAQKAVYIWTNTRENTSCNTSCKIDYRIYISNPIAKVKGIRNSNNFD